MNPTGQSTVDIQTNLDLLSNAGGPAIQTDLGIIVASFINAALIIGALATLMYLIIGGLRWITAGGDKGKVEKARETILQGVIGLAVLASSWALFLIVQYFFGIDIGVVTGGGRGNGGGGGGQICQVGQTGYYTGQYCSPGRTYMRCFGPGQGPTSQANYNHWEPCSCEQGESAQQSGYDFSAC